MLARARAWLDDRTGYRAALSGVLDERVRGGPSWAYVFGSVLTFVLVNQVVTGVLLATYYSPSATDAWASVAYVQDQVTLGWLVRGLHAHGASAMVIVAGLHLLQVAVWGAYKRPREVNWLVGVLLLGVILTFALTGYLLPWDQKGYWATKVTTGIVGSTPAIGGWLQAFVQGGNEYGNLTLTRFYALHVVVLPAATLLLLALHLALFRRHGVTPRWGRTDAELDARSAPFWPDQLVRDMVAVAVTFGALLVFVVRAGGADLGPPADPGASFDARPEWYFLSLFQLLKYFPGRLEPVASLGIPLVGALLLLGLPFLDRGPERAPVRRARSLAALGVLFVGTGALTALALRDDARDAALGERLVTARAQADKARRLARLGVPPAGGTAVYENEPHFRARRLFADRCAGCHVGDERKGPELAAGYNSRAWIAAFLKDPDGERFFGVTEDLHEMKPVEETGADLAALVELVYAETGAPDAEPALVEHGRRLFDEGDCIDCHSRDATSEGDVGPNLGGRGTVQWLAAMIAEPGHPRFFGEKNEMPAFRGKLRPDEIDALARYLASLRDEAPPPVSASSAASPSSSGGGAR